MKTIFFWSVLFLSVVLLCTACPPDDDDDNDDATPSDDDTSDDDIDDDDTTDDDTSDDDTSDDDTTDDDTTDDDSADDDFVDDDSTDDDTSDDDTADDDSVDDDTTDDDTTDDDTADDDSADDDTIDDDTADDDTGDDDTSDDDTTDDDTADDDIVVENVEYIFGGVAWPFDLAGSDEGPMYISAQIGGRPCLFTLDDNDGFTTELLPATLVPIDVQVDPFGNVHLLAEDEANDQLKHLWRENDVWHTEIIPEYIADGWAGMSDMAFDAAGNIHLCQDGYDTYYVTNASGQWTHQFIQSTWIEPTTACLPFVAPDGAVHLTYLDTWYDWQGHPFHKLSWTTNRGGQWQNHLFTDYAALSFSYMSFDEQSNADVVYHTTDGLIYGFWDGDHWTTEVVSTTMTNYQGIWRIDDKPTILLQDSTAANTFTATLQADSWTITDLGAATGYSLETVPTAAGQWRFLFENLHDHTLHYLNDLSGAWDDLTIFSGPAVGGPVSHGIDEQGRRFLLAGTNQGWRKVIWLDDEWQVEPFDLGVASLSNAEIVTDDQGVTHLVGNSGLTIVYADNQGGSWQSEIVTEASPVSQVFNLRPDGEPVIVYQYNNKFYCLERTADGWNNEELPIADTVYHWTYGVGGNADGDVFLCYEVEYYDLIRCARRHEGQWTVDTIEASADIVVGTRAMAIDADGAPHYIYAAAENDNKSIHIRLAVFTDGAWEITDLADHLLVEAELIIDDDGVHHLAALRSNNDNTLLYATDAGGVWHFQEVATEVNLHLTAKPELLADGSVQLAFRSGSGLWRTVIAPPVKR